MSCHECRQMQMALTETDGMLEDAHNELCALRAENGRLLRQIEDIMTDTSYSSGLMQEKIRQLEAELAKYRKQEMGRPIDPEAPYTAFPGRGRKSGGLGPWGRRQS
jgi:hypothetical protein